MAVNNEQYEAVIRELTGRATLVAVSKTKPVEDILELYRLGQRDFGENYVQELVEKQRQLPADIRWHFIGHLQTNKVKQVAPFVHLVQGVDSPKLLHEINKQAAKLNRVIDVLLQVYIAKEETKFGLDEQELAAILRPEQPEPLTNICICGLMGMASFSPDNDVINKEFAHLKSVYDEYAGLQTPQDRFRFLSMGMSSDYRLALQNGSNMIRIGSLLFGAREKTGT